MTMFPFAPLVSTVNTNVPPQNDGGAPPKPEELGKFNAALNPPTTSSAASNAQSSSKGTDQSQGTLNSYQLLLATSPPLNLAKPAQPYAGETPKGPPSKTDAAPKDDKKAPADTTQDNKRADANTTQTESGTSTSQCKDASKDAVVDEKTKGATPQNGATGAADDDKPHLETNGQALGTLNRSSDGKPFGSLDVSESVVWKNKNLGPEAKLGDRTEVSMGHEPQGSVGVSLHMRDHDDATTPGGKPPAESTHVQVQGSIGIVNVTRKDDKGHDLVEGELDAVVGIDSYAGKNQVQGSLQLTGEYHINDKASVIIQANIPVGDQPPPPSVGAGIKVTF
jgi:hypothetical protein